MPQVACVTCRHFDDAPAALEAAFPGLSSLSSAHAAVRSGDGLCAAHERYVTAANVCSRHAPRA